MFFSNTLASRLIPGFILVVALIGLEGCSKLRLSSNNSNADGSTGATNSNNSQTSTPTSTPSNPSVTNPTPTPAPTQKILGTYDPAQVKSLEVTFVGMAVPPQGWPQITIALDASSQTATATIHRLDTSLNVVCTGSQNLNYSTLLQQLASDPVVTIPVPSGPPMACGDCGGPSLILELADASTQTIPFESGQIDITGGTAIKGTDLENYLYNLADQAPCQ